MKTSETSLSPNNRPSHIQKKIDEVFNILSQDSLSAWGLYNGQNFYDTFEVNEGYVLKSMINQNINQKEFYVLEVGAGNFQFGQSLTKFINKQIQNASLPDDIVVNIISVRGENNYQSNYQIQNCKIWEVGNFKIENLLEEFNNKGLNDFVGKFDLIVSNYTLRHLVDPLGTFIQMHKSLKIGGLMLTDTFEFNIIDNQNIEYPARVELVLTYLHQFGDEVLVRKGFDSRGYERIAVKKHNDNFEVPFSYHSFKQDNWGSYFEIYKCDQIPNNGFKDIYKKIQSSGFIGDKSLFMELINALYIQKKEFIATENNNESLWRDEYNASSDHCLDDDFISYKQNAINIAKQEIEEIYNCATGQSNLFHHHLMEYQYIGDGCDHNIESTANIIGVSDLNII